MRVSNIAIVELPGACQVQARVLSERQEDHDEWFPPFDLWFRFPAWCRSYMTLENGDPFVAALLVAAMRTSERLVVAAPVSPRLMAALPDIQAIYAAFDKRAHRITVEAAVRAEPLPFSDEPQSTGLFFSLGVDSFYSLLKKQREQAAGDNVIGHLISVQGFDVADEESDRHFSPQFLTNLQRVAAATHTMLLPVETNVRRATAWLAPWTIVHGGAMAAVALALGGAFRRVTIAASATYDTISPWGTHPLLDPLWSTESLQIVHDGCEMDTIDKTWFNACSDLFLETVRVCPGYAPEYNCGRCLKCLRTMLDLWQSGHLDRCHTLPHHIDPGQLRQALRVGDGPVHTAAFRRRLAYVESADGPPGVRDALIAHLDGDEFTKPSPARRKLRWRARALT
ncbi:MAG: hypothetical protein H0V00_16590 [Chloroflexia bacterium]|nr:hypothetical protein [Chloroflexia bacterium]